MWSRVIDTPRIKAHDIKILGRSSQRFRLRLGRIKLGVNYHLNGLALEFEEGNSRATWTAWIEQDWPSISAVSDRDLGWALHQCYLDSLAVVVSTVPVHWDVKSGTLHVIVAGVKFERPAGWDLGVCKIK